MIPRRYGIGSGLLIDSTGNESQQTDIVVFDQAEEPALLAQTTQVLFPVENVHICIEVKTSVARKDIIDAGRKQESLMRLNPVGGRKGPLSAFLGYSGSIQPETLVEHINALQGDHVDNRPDIICVLELGLFAARESLLSWKRSETAANGYIVGLTCLHEREETVRVPGRFRQPPEEHTDGDYFEGGSVYPIVKAAGTYWIAEPSRALLLFCETLINALSTRERRDLPAMSSYITPTARDLLMLSD